MNVTSRTSAVINGEPLSKGISVTSDDVIGNYNRLLVELKRPDVIASLKAVEDQQAASEDALVKNTSICNVTALGAIRERIGGLRANEMKDILQKQFQNPSAMKGAMCTIDSLFYTSPYDVGSLYLNNRIRMYLHNLRQIGSESLEGYTLVSDFENSKDMFVIKTSRSPSDDTLLHELVTGLYGTNLLRQYIPNFAYVYGGFQCSPPLVDPVTGKVVTWCLHEDNSVNYVLYENITPSISLKEYIKTCTGKEFINVYMQVLYALRLALKVCDFTHYDLHYENVMIRSIDNNKRQFQIAYETERGAEYITTTVVPTIIDYGFSHVKAIETVDQSGKQLKPGRHYGRNGFVQFSIYSYRSWIMHDLYKLLMFCILGASQNNNQSVLLEATKIFRFFNRTEDPIAALHAQGPIRFAFPLTDATNTLSIDDLAMYIRNVCGSDYIYAQPTTDSILDCQKMCLTEAAFLTKIGMNPEGPIGIPDNIIEFYDIATRLQNENREAEKLAVAKAFPYQQCMRAHINKMQTMIRDLVLLRSQLKLVDVGQMTINQVLDYNTMSIVRSMYVSVGAIIDKTVELRFLHEIGVAIALSYNDSNAVTVMNGIMDRFNKEVRPALEDTKRVLGSNGNYLDRIKTDAVVTEALRRDQRLRWYWEGRNLFDIVFGRTIDDS